MNWGVRLGLGMCAVVAVSLITFPAVILLVAFGVVSELVHRAEES